MAIRPTPTPGPGRKIYHGDPSFSKIEIAALMVAVILIFSTIGAYLVK